MTSTTPWRMFVFVLMPLLPGNLQAELDAEAAGLASGAARPSSRPGITIGRSARPSGAPRQPTAAPTVAPPARSKRQRSDRSPLSADPVPEDYAAPGFRYPPRGGIRPRYPVTTPVVDTPLLTGLHDHPSSSVIRCEDPPESIGRGGWSEFCQLLEIARPEYREFLAELGFGPFLSIRYVHVWHPLVRCWVERFFHHTGTIHLSTCEMGVLPVDWSAILGIRFGGRIPPSDPVPDFEALEILGIADPHAIVGKNRPSLRISYLKALLRREIEEPPIELRFISGACAASPVERLPVSSASGSSLFTGHSSISEYLLPADFQWPLTPYFLWLGDGIQLGSSD
uniref:Aminotransferase-like plant mobile domain-containing protein n=1 Tax=Fagus sylvatica TaxID=28930 RepID=A0A2N9FCR1_FAGSY